MFHARPIFLSFSWQASPCVAERPGVTSGATIGVTYHQKIGPDFQVVKCQV